MNSTLGVIEALNGLFLAIEGQADSGPYPYFYGRPLPERYEQDKATYMRLEKKDENSGKKDMPAGAVFVMYFAMCVNDLIKRPGMIEAMLHRPKVFKKLTKKAVLKYAEMDVPAFAQALYDICTDNGQKLTSADDIGKPAPIMLDRCLYAAYVYTQVAEYLERITNTFMPVPLPNGLMQFPFLNTGDISYEARTRQGVSVVGDTEFVLINANLKPATMLLFLYLLYRARATQSASVYEPLLEYAKVRKRSTTKAAMQKFRVEVNEQLAELKEMKYRGFAFIKGKRTPTGVIEFNGGSALIENGNIRWNFNQDLYESLFNDLPEDVPREIFSLNLRKYANAFYFGMYIAQNWRLNEADMPARRKIPMRTLISITPELPTHEEVKKSNGNYLARIIRPVFENLDILETIDYDFFTATDKQMQPEDVKDYETFINGYIRINYEEYPQHLAFVENKHEHQNKRKKAREKGQLKGIEAAAAKTAEKQEQERQAE